MRFFEKSNFFIFSFLFMTSKSPLFETHELPCTLKDKGQTVVLAINDVITPFIFGGQFNNDIYKFNHKSGKYEIYDRYRTQNIVILAS